MTTAFFVRGLKNTDKSKKCRIWVFIAIVVNFLAIQSSGKRSCESGWVIFDVSNDHGDVKFKGETVQSVTSWTCWLLDKGSKIIRNVYELSASDTGSHHGTESIVCVVDQRTVKFYPLKICKYSMTKVTEVRNDSHSHQVLQYSAASCAIKAVGNR